jgi:putative molybdopterin biosynthesis protein
MREDDFDHIPLDEALERWISELEFRKIISLSPPEDIPAEKSIGRITAEPVLAGIYTPFYYSAVCDGVCVKSSDTQMAHTDNPLKLKIGKEAYFVDTGGVIPEGFDAVLSIHDVQLQSLEEIVLDHPVTPWKNIRPIGEDMSANDVILSENKVITPFDIGALCAGGIRRVQVRKKPRIGILPVGANLIPPGSPPQVGKSIDFKSIFLEQLVETYHGEAQILAFVPEKIEDVKKIFKKGLDKYDIFFVIGGPSWGTRIIKKSFLELGELIVGSVNINPGSSICLGIIDGKPVIGLPEHPVSIYLGFELLGKPLIHKIIGMDCPIPHKIHAVLGRQERAQKDVEKFVRVNLGEVGGKLVALPISRGEAVLMSLVKADGLLRIPGGGSGVKAGQTVEITIMPHMKDFRKNILMTGTYDICIDVLKNHIERKYSGVSLHSANIGSIVGMKALRAGLAHISGIHAFDRKTGKYNVPFIKKLVPDVPLVLVNLFHRKIGLLVRKGNPKRIRSHYDLTRSDVVFVNRQKGSGTRSILEYHLNQDGIDSDKIHTYPLEAKTHIFLASIIASGLADTGFGILPAAKAFKLDFIPLFPETFDLVVPRQFLNTFVAQIILNIINSIEFRNEIGSMGGYDLTYTGKITYRQE